MKTFADFDKWWTRQQRAGKLEKGSYNIALTVWEAILMSNRDAVVKVPSAMARAFAEKFHEKYLRRAAERKRSLAPWSDFEFDELFERLQDETSELYEAATELKDLKAVMDECLDVANFA